MTTLTPKQEMKVLLEQMMKEYKDSIEELDSLRSKLFNQYYSAWKKLERMNQ